MDNKGLALAQVLSQAASGYFMGKADTNLQQGKYRQGTIKFYEGLLKDKNVSAAIKNSTILPKLRELGIDVPEGNVYSDPTPEGTIGDKVSNITSQKQELNYTPTALPQAGQVQPGIGQFQQSGIVGAEMPQAQTPEITGPTGSDKLSALYTLAAEENIPKNIIDEIAEQSGLKQKESFAGDLSPSQQVTVINAYSELNDQGKKLFESQYPWIKDIKRTKKARPSSVPRLSIPKQKQYKEIEDIINYYVGLSKKQPLDEQDTAVESEAKRLKQNLIDGKNINLKDMNNLRKSYEGRKPYPQRESEADKLLRGLGITTDQNQPVTNKPVLDY